MVDPLLVTREVSRYFGGLAAVNGVSIALRRGELHAVLGPNGAGKSTLINLLSGDLPVSSGHIFYKGDEISALSVDRRSRLGVGRSYQKTNVFSEFTAFENCRLAAQSRDPHPFQFLSDALGYSSVNAVAESALERAGLSARRHVAAAALSHGEQRQLEIAMVLATQPEVLLLDEPLAGMGSEESTRMVALLRALAANHAIMLVEHDMDAVFAAADLITVMVNGQILESGSREQIRASRAVHEVYLGEDLNYVG